MYWNHWRDKKEFRLKRNHILLNWKDYENGKLTKKGADKFNWKYPKKTWSNRWDGRGWNIEGHIDYIEVMIKPSDSKEDLSTKTEFFCDKKTTEINPKKLKCEYYYGKTFSCVEEDKQTEILREDFLLKYILVKNN